MSPIETLDRWYRDIEPKPTGTDIVALLRLSGAWLLWAPLVCLVVGMVDALNGPGFACGAMSFVAFGALRARRCSRIETDRATARGATIVQVLSVSALSIGGIARFTGLCGVGLCFWIVPPVVMGGLALLKSFDWNERWSSPSPRRVARAFASGVGGGVLLAGVSALQALAPTRAQGHRVVEPAAWQVAYEEFSASGFRRAGYDARAGVLRLHWWHVGGFFKWDSDDRLSVMDDELPAHDFMPWTYGTVELLYNGCSRAVTLFNGTHAARFAQGTKVAQWRTLVAAPCSNALWLVLVSAAGVIAAGVVWRRTRRAVAPFEDRAAWHDGTLAPDGTITPEDGGATAQAPERLRGTSGPVVFRRVCGKAQTTGVPYRVPAPGGSAEVFLGARASLDAKVKHVREAWAVWALVVVTASVAPLVVAVVTAPFWPWTTP